MIEKRGQAFLEFLGDDMLEAFGFEMGTVRGEAEAVGEETFEQTVMAGEFDRGASAGLGEFDTPVGLVLHQAFVTQALEHFGDKRSAGAGARGDVGRQGGRSGGCEGVDGLEDISGGFAEVPFRA